ncbi:MAG: ABC transporter ATP-binding protein [Clostridiales bacterium]
MLEMRELSVIYPDQTKGIDKLDLKIKDNENIALIGANGAGKTSLIMSLVGVIPAQGDILLDGLRLEKKTVREIRSRIGVVFQNPDDQLFMPSIYDDIAFGLRNRGLSEPEIDERVGRSLSQLGIEDLRHKTALKLSGGENRMAALATVLVMEPSLMLFDEPNSFFDHKARRNLIRILADLPYTKLIATHDLCFAAEVCQRAVLLKKGRLFADGPCRQLLYDAPLMDQCGVESIGIYLKGGLA